MLQSFGYKALLHDIITIVTMKSLGLFDNETSLHTHTEILLITY